MGWQQRLYMQDIKVTADGTKTHRQMLKSLADAIVAAAQQLNSNEFAKVESSATINGYYCTLLANITLKRTVSSIVWLANYQLMGNVSVGTSQHYVYFLRVGISDNLNSCYIYRANVLESSASYSDISSDIAASGGVYQVRIIVYRDI